MNAQRIEDLDAMARGFIDGDIDRMSLISLPVFDMWYVLTMANVYSCTKIGTISQTACVKFKYKVANDYKMFESLTAYGRLSHEAWIKGTKQYSGISCDISRELGKDKPDAVILFSNMLRLLDLLTKENVLHQLFVRRIENPAFLKSCIDAVHEHGDEWREEFEHIRDEDYVNLLQKFYAATDEDRMARMYASLDADHLKDFARRTIPVKQDDTGGIAEGIGRMYGERRN